MGEAREEVRPRDRTGIGVGDVDLDLRNDDESAGERERELRRREHVSEPDQIHLRGLGGALRRDQMLDGEKSQERPRQHLQHAGDDPAGTGGQIGGPPAQPPTTARRREKSQEVHLLADLRDQREHHGCGGAEQHEIERPPIYAPDPGKAGPSFERLEVRECDENEGNEMQHDPDRLRPQLQPADEGDAVGDQWNDDQRTQHVAGEQRNAEAHFQRKRHDGRLDGKEQKGEGGVDQRRDRRADIAKAGTAGQKIDIDAIGRGV